MSQRDRLMRERLLERVVVTLTTGETFDGMLHAVDDKSLTLLQASAVNAEGHAVKADGSVLIPRANVRYLQKP